MKQMIYANNHKDKSNSFLLSDKETWYVSRAIKINLNSTEDQQNRIANPETVPRNIILNCGVPKGHLSMLVKISRFWDPIRKYSDMPGITWKHLT